MLHITFSQVFFFGKIRTNSKFIDLALAHDSKSQARLTPKSTPSPSTARYQRAILISKHHKLIRFSRNFQFFSNGISIDRSRPDIHLVFIFHTHETSHFFSDNKFDRFERVLQPTSNRTTTRTTLTTHSTCHCTFNSLEFHDNSSTVRNICNLATFRSVRT